MDADIKRQINKAKNVGNMAEDVLKTSEMAKIVTCVSRHWWSTFISLFIMQMNAYSTGTDGHNVFLYTKKERT